MNKIKNSLLFIQWMDIMIMKICGNQFAIFMTKFNRKKKNDFNIFHNLLFYFYNTIFNFIKKI